MRLLAAFAVIATALSLPAAAADGAARVILVGDSTMASNSGYGDALCQRFVAGVTCINLARGGRSSGSFRAEGRWDEVMTLLRSKDSNGPTYVLIQFGHNDQPGKPGRSTDLVTQFPANMERYATEVKQLGGVPVLVTPLTRRSFKGPYLRDDLAPWRAATLAAARNTQTALLDLNALSAAAVQAMGEDEADTLAMEPRPPAAPSTSTAQAEPQGKPTTRFDRTHLGAKGAALFSAMVAHELAKVVPATKPLLKPE